MKEEKNKRKMFKCNETNEVFYSLRDCENKLNIPHRNIGKVLKGTRKSTRNLTFSYLIDL